MFEINCIFCHNICWQGDHKCFENDEDNDLLGLDVENIKADFGNCLYEKTFRCEMCEFTCTAIQNVKEHFLHKHINSYKRKYR